MNGLNYSNMTLISNVNSVICYNESVSWVKLVHKAIVCVKAISRFIRYCCDGDTCVKELAESVKKRFVLLTCS
ncbi:hypothetical protein SDC9_85501 [bioreactor metagenome]|uniref:Uncharacterized protein n=1 Tax=bioreactor metagenome TaxID=1076179 RepID=A0A644ZG57_9ZZZZ